MLAGLLCCIVHACLSLPDQAEEREATARAREVQRDAEQCGVWARILGPAIRVAILCGGAGPDREASVDAARAAAEHIDTLHMFAYGERRRRGAADSCMHACMHACHACHWCPRLSCMPGSQAQGCQRVQK